MARPDALSLQVLLAVADGLRVVTVANGYRTDAGLNATVDDDYVANATGPNLFVGAVSMPFDGAASSNVRQQTLNLAIEFSLPVRARDAWRIAHNALQDVVDAFPSIAYPAGIASPKLDATAILRRPEGADVIVAQATAHVVLIQRKPGAQ